MVEGTDFAQQTRAVNVIDDIIITEERRVICYNLQIYDDPCLEPDEMTILLCWCNACAVPGWLKASAGVYTGFYNGCFQREGMRIACAQIT